jgi:endonuclease/exonuclease/phosphatase family metal-dependent hydrolase
MIMKTKPTQNFDHLKYIHFDNDQVLQKTHSDVRVLTYNVHGFRDGNQHNKLQEIINVIKEINPDVFVLEEVYTYKKNDPITEEKLKDKLAMIGYRYSAFSSNGINAVFSNHPFENREVQLGRDNKYKILRNALFCRFSRCKNKFCKLDGILFVGTHLDVYDESGILREKQMRTIIETINNIGIDKVIIAGDLNSLRKNDYTQIEWEYIVDIDKKRKVNTIEDAIPLIEEAGFIDSFVGYKKSINLSVWSGRRVDYIYGKNIKFKNSATYKKTFSDHYPIYADF